MLFAVFILLATGFLSRLSLLMIEYHVIPISPATAGRLFFDPAKLTGKK